MRPVLICGGGALGTGARYPLSWVSSSNHEFLMLATRGAGGPAAPCLGLTASCGRTAGFLGIATARAIAGLGADLAAG